MGRWRKSDDLNLWSLWHSDTDILSWEKRMLSFQQGSTVLEDTDVWPKWCSPTYLLGLSWTILHQTTSLGCEESAAERQHPHRGCVLPVLEAFRSHQGKALGTWAWPWSWPKHLLIWFVTTGTIGSSSYLWWGFLKIWTIYSIFH